MSDAQAGPVDSADLATLLPQLVPLVGTLGIVYEELSPAFARLRLPDAPGLHNHLGRLHAGALFTLGESASGAIVVAALADRLGEITPLVAAATITYHRLAKGDVSAVATTDTSADDLGIELSAHGRANLSVEVTLTSSDGTTNTTMHVHWVLTTRA